MPTSLFSKSSKSTCALARQLLREKKGRNQSPCSVSSIPPSFWVQKERATKEEDIKKDYQPYNHHVYNRGPDQALALLESIYGSNVWVCGWNPIIPFKSNFFSNTFSTLWTEPPIAGRLYLNRVKPLRPPHPKLLDSLQLFRPPVVSPTSSSLTSEVVSCKCWVSSQTAFAWWVAEITRYIHACCTYLYHHCWENEVYTCAALVSLR